RESRDVEGCARAHVGDGRPVLLRRALSRCLVLRRRIGGSNTMTRAVALAELAPDAQERVRAHAGIALGPDSPLLPGLVNVKLENAIKSRRRTRAGQWFEKELEQGHAIYRAQGRAVLHRRVPPMVKLRGE